MDEKLVIKKSFPVYIVLLTLSLIGGLLTDSFSFAIGITVGYIINLIIFNLIIYTSKTILELQAGSVTLIIILFIIKLIIYASGFYLAILLDDLILLAGVFFGYFIIKITINLCGYIYKGGGVDD